MSNGVPTGDLRSRVAMRIAASPAPIPASLIARRARLVAGIATAGAKAAARAVRRRVGADASGIEPEVALAASLGRLKGPLMKWGQVLGYAAGPGASSVRHALAALHTHAAPVDADRVRAILDEDLGDPGRALARTLDPAPLAAGSIGQVHRAVLPHGARVAVKVVHPAIASIIARDFAPALLVSRLVSRVSAPLHAAVAEVEQRLLDECDYRIEARMQDRFRGLFAGDPTVVIPDVYAAYSTSRVLTTSYVEGAHLDAFLASSPSHEAKQRAAEAIFDVYVGALFKHGVTHGDPHPGNYLFAPDGKVAFVDFGSARAYDLGVAASLASLARAVRDEDTDGTHRALHALGIEASARADRASIEWLLRVALAPLAGDDVRFGWGPGFTARQAIVRAWRARSVVLSGELAFLLRTFVGVSSVLARLDAHATWRDRLERAVEPPVRSTLAPPPPAPVEPSPQKVDPSWDLVLVEAGPNPIALIRDLRELMGMDLRKLHDLVDSVPQTLKHAVSRADAETVRQRLEAVGARVEVRRASIPA